MNNYSLLIPSLLGMSFIGSASAATLLNFSTPGVLETDAPGGAVGDIYRINGVTGSVDALIEITGIGGNDSNPSIIQNPINIELDSTVAQDPYVTFRLTLVNDGTSVQTTINDTVNIVVYDLDTHDGNANNSEMTDIFGFLSSETPDLGVYTSSSTAIELGGWNQGGGPSGFTSVRMSQAYAGATDTWIDEVNADIAVLAEQAPVAIRLSYSSFSSAEYAFGFTGREGVTPTPGIRQRELYFDGQDPSGLTGLTTSLNTNLIPEPASITLLGIGAFGLMLRRKRD